MEHGSTTTSRSFAVLVIILILIGLSALVPAKWIGVDSKKYEQPKLDLSKMTDPSELASDTNGDGAVSWKEIVTNSLDVSSTTLEEIRKIPVDKKLIAELNDPNNLTASFSKNLYLTGVYFDKNNITDEKMKKEAVDKLVQDEAAKIKTTVYTYKDVNVSSDDSKEAIKKYGNAVATILNNILSKKTIESNLTGLALYTQSKNGSDLAPILQDKVRVDAILQKLIKLPVPVSASMQHVVVLNRVAAYRDMLDSLGNAESDPLRATIVVDNYVNVSILVGRLFSQFSDYFITKNVVFSPNEAGYVFVIGYTMPK